LYASVFIQVCLLGLSVSQKTQAAYRK